jgi:hypothetical protein
MRLAAHPFLLLAPLLAALPAAAQTPAARVTVEAISVQAFLQRSGKFTENLVGTKKALFNSVIGEGDIGEPAEDVLVTVTFGGRENPSGVPDKAATVTISWAAAGKKEQIRRAEGGFLFGANGRFSKTYLLRNATCSPITVEAAAGDSRRTATVSFRCGE